MQNKSGVESAAKLQEASRRELLRLALGLFLEEALVNYTYQWKDGMDVLGYFAVSKRAELAVLARLDRLGFEMLRMRTVADGTRFYTFKRENQVVNVKGVSDSAA